MDDLGNTLRLLSQHPELLIARVWTKACRRLILSLFAILVSAPTAAADQIDVSGRWIGTYSCGGAQVSDLFLEISEQNTLGVLQGVLAFEAPEGTASYNISGRLQADGRLTIVPQDWIERPAGFTARGVEASISANGRRLEGRMTSCAMGSFTVGRDESARAIGAAEDTPLSGGVFAGLWRGNVECRANRRGNTELLPLDATLWQDGGGVAGIATLRIWQKRNSGGGAYWDQKVLLTGRVADNDLALRAVVLDSDGSPYPLNLLSGTLQPDGSVSGQARFSSCETFTIRKEAAAPAPSLVPHATGPWVGSGGRQGATLVTLGASLGSDPPFWLLEAVFPVSRPESQRDRLRLVAVPVAQQNGVMILAPVNAREATGPFDPGNHPPYHALTGSVAFLLHFEDESELSLLAIPNGPNIRRAMAEALAFLPTAGRDSSRLYYRLVQPEKDVFEAMGAGELPPLDLGPGIGGLLADATSREDQCRILDRWLAPYTAGHDMQRVEISEGRRILADAFGDSTFTPVFGMPFLLTSQPERNAIARLIRETCTRQMSFQNLNFVGNQMLSETHFQRVATMLADRTESTDWRETLTSELANLPADEAGLARIAAARAELRTRQQDLTRSEHTGLAALIDRREAELKAGALLAQAEALPDDGFERGALDRVFGLMNRLQASDLDRSLLLPAREIAEQRAQSILNPVLREIGMAAAQQPHTLDGLAAIMVGWNRLTPARHGMQRHFGYFDRERQLADLEAGQRRLWADPAILEAFRTHLAGVQTGPIAQPVLENEAARYFDLEQPNLAPGWAEVLSDAIALAELRAVQVSLLAASMPEGAPSAQEIAMFAFNRVRDVNSGLDALERRCKVGQFQNPLEALQCLTVLGAQGVRAKLHEVRVAGCVAEVDMQQYRCTFSQRVTVSGGGAAGGWWSEIMGDLTSAEAVDARFIRAAQGGWSVVTGDLR